MTAEEDEYLAGIIPRLKLRKQRKAERLEENRRIQAEAKEQYLKGE